MKGPLSQGPGGPVLCLLLPPAGSGQAGHSTPRLTEDLSAGHCGQHPLGLVSGAPLSGGWARPVVLPVRPIMRAACVCEGGCMLSLLLTERAWLSSQPGWG